MPGQAALSRVLGLFSAVLFVVGGTVGSGILFTPAEVARALPNGSWVLGLWALGGLVTFAGVLSYSELGALMPEAGGPYIYIRDAFGRLPAFLYGWMTLFGIASGALAAVALAFASYVPRPELFPGGRISLAVTVILFFGVTNCLSTHSSAWLQNVLTLIKIAGLLALILAGCAPAGTFGAALEAVPDAAPAVPAPPMGGLPAALIAVLFAFGGWHQMSLVAGEVRDSRRAIPRALVIGIVIVIALYLGVNAVYLKALGHAGLATSRAVATDTAARLAGSAAARLIGAYALIGLASAVNVIIFANSRIFFAMARDGVFPGVAARVHPAFGTPYAAVAILGGFAIALVLGTGGNIGALLGGVVFADWFFLGLGAACIFVLRGRRPPAPGGFRAWGYPLLPACFVAVAFFAVLSSYIAALYMSLFQTAVLAVGVVAFRWMEHNARLASGSLARLKA